MSQSAATRTENGRLLSTLDDLGVPVLGGLPFGHIGDPVPVPLGVPAVLDADAGQLTVDSTVQ